VNVQDRLQNGGRSQHFGDGDTPVGAVMAVLAEAGGRIPALVEYSYSGLGTSSSEVRDSVAFLRQALK